MVGAASDTEMVSVNVLVLLPAALVAVKEAV